MTGREESGVTGGRRDRCDWRKKGLVVIGGRRG